MKKITFTAWAVPLLWMLTSILGSYTLYAQSQPWVVSGVVTDEQSQPLEGVVVWQPHTDSQTLTNELGYYTLSIEKEEAIHFEYLGYQTVVRKASGSVLNVSLKPSDEELDEIIINAGYYNVSDKERTGSISRITAKEISQQPVANPLAAMQGRMAGVNITQNSGVPGGGFDIQIRGRNSLRTEGNAPLYIVDGVPYPSQSVSDISLSAPLFAGNVSPLNSINPNVIESIEVLKDADATAIYGSRGANGVVLITTKQGNSKKTTFSLSSNTSISTVANFMKLMNTEEYLEMRKAAFINDGIIDYPANAYDINGTWDQTKYTNWQKEFIGNKMATQNTQISIGSGSGNTNFLFSAGLRNDGSVYIGDFGYNRKNFLINFNHHSSDNRFRMFINFQNSEQKNKLMASDFTSATFLPPNAPNLYENGDLNWEHNTFENPLARLNAKYNSKTKDFISQMNLEYEWFANIKSVLRLGMSSLSLEETKINPHTIYNPAYGLTSANSSIIKSDYDGENWIVEPQLHWNKIKQNSSLNVIVGSTFEEKMQRGISIVASDFTSNDFINNISNAKNQMVQRDTESVYRYQAIFGRLNYNLYNKYILNLTGRRDGSSRFGANNRFANYGAVGFAWLLSNEKFLSNSKMISFAKIRTSYGIMGSDLIGDYQYLNTFGISPYKYDGHMGLDALRLYNPDFSWESTKKFELALELEFLENRLSTALSYYNNRSSNQLVGIPLPATTGFASVQSNLNATVQNQGIEFLLRSVNSNSSNFRWVTDFNISFPSNKLLEFPNLEESTYGNTYVIGQPITIKKVYNYLGVNQSTGLYEVEDVNNDGEITIEDKTAIENLGVQYYGGINNSIQFKNWNIDFLWQFVKQKNYTPDYYNNLLGIASNSPKRAMDYFSENNPNATYQKPTMGLNYEAQEAFWLYKESNGVISDASYIRLKSLQINYRLDNQLFKNTQASIYIQGHNLITITKFWGNDPESIGTLLPPLRTWALGFNINF